MRVIVKETGRSQRTIAQSAPREGEALAADAGAASCGRSTLRSEASCGARTRRRDKDERTARRAAIPAVLLKTGKAPRTIPEFGAGRSASLLSDSETSATWWPASASPRRIVATYASVPAIWRRVHNNGDSQRSSTGGVHRGQATQRPVPFPSVGQHRPNTRATCGTRTR
jgi:hypothetical protein